MLLRNNFSKFILSLFKLLLINVYVSYLLTFNFFNYKNKNTRRRIIKKFNNLEESLKIRVALLVFIYFFPSYYVMQITKCCLSYTPFRLLILVILTLRYLKYMSGSTLSLYIANLHLLAFLHSIARYVDCFRTEMIMFILFVNILNL